MVMAYLPPMPINPPDGSPAWRVWFESVRGMFNRPRMWQGVDTDDDVITDSTTKGPVMKSPNGHYWRATISNAGVVTWTDLGTTKP